MRIFIVDDEPDILTQVSQMLIREKYQVETASDGQAALQRIFNQPFDLLILDIMLPGKDGLALLREVRQAKITTPVLMLTAKCEIDDRIRGLDEGADDYIPKPFSAAELLARIRAILRRVSEHASPVLEAAQIRLDTVKREVSVSGTPVQLTPKEFAILEFLLYNRNRAVSRFSLAEHVWGDDFDPFTMSNYIDVHIRNLRRKIGDDDAAVLQTLRGVGYILKVDGR